MTKREFLNTLQDKLSPSMNDEELSNLIDYYDSYLDEAEEMGNKVEDVIAGLGDIDTLVSEILENLKAENIDYDFREFMVIDDAGKQPFILDVDCFNFGIVVTYCDIDRIRVMIHPSYINQFDITYDDTQLMIKQRKDIFKRFTNNTKIYIEIPVKMEVEAYIKTKNAGIKVKGGKDVSVEKAVFTTNNGSVKVKELKGNIEIITINGMISIEDCSGYQIFASTKNASIHMEACTYDLATLDTTNGNIKIRKCDIIGLKAMTTNAKVKLEVDPRQTIQLKYHTSNAKVMIFDQRYPKVGEYLFKGEEDDVRSFYIKTSNGKIAIEED